MSGYLDRPDMSAETIVDGWLLPEDAGREEEPAWDGPWPRCGFLVAAAFFSVDQRAFLGAPADDLLLGMRIQLS